LKTSIAVFRAGAVQHFAFLRSPESTVRILPTIALLTLTALPAAAAPAMQPGLYEISMQMAMKNTPMRMPVATFRHCITAKDIADGNAYASSENSKDCTIGNLRQSGSAVSYDFACAMEDSGRMVGRSSGTRHASGYDIVMSGRFVPATEGLSEFSQNLRARRLGACK
jgi:hypothetical protein